MDYADIKKGKLVICDNNGKETDSVNFTFNPSSYRMTSAPYYRQVKHLAEDDEKTEFVGGVARTLSVTLIFDSYSDPDIFPKKEAKNVTNMTMGVENQLKPITDKIKKIELASHIVGDQHHPPMVIFEWGNLEFHGYITELTIDYTMFSMEGKPIRATVQLQISEERDPNVTKMKSPFQSPDRTKSRVVVEGMSLWSIAWDEYDDCEKWRIIARANNIMNPMDIKPGQIIRIPALDRE